MYHRFVFWRSVTVIWTNMEQWWIEGLICSCFPIYFPPNSLQGPTKLFKHCAMVCIITPFRDKACNSIIRRIYLMQQRLVSCPMYIVSIIQQRQNQLSCNAYPVLPCSALSISFTSSQLICHWFRSTICQQNVKRKPWILLSSSAKVDINGLAFW